MRRSSRSAGGLERSDSATTHGPTGVARTPVFELRNVAKRYGGRAAVDGVDLRVHAGERVALVGPSGAGKTTLLRLLNASLPPDAGEVRIFGEDPRRMTPGGLRRIQRRIGTMHQPFHLVGNLRVIHNVNAGHLGRWSLWRAAWSLLRPQAVDGALEWLTAVGLRDKVFERTDRLSGGEQQRVALVRLLVQDAPVILADEPISSLDPEHSRLVMDLLRELNDTAGKTEVFSLHDVSYAFSHCLRIVGLRLGRIVFDARASEIPRRVLDDLYRVQR